MVPYGAVNDRHELAADSASVHVAFDPEAARNTRVSLATSDLDAWEAENERIEYLQSMNSPY